MKKKTIEEILGTPPKWAINTIVPFGAYKGESLGGIVAVNTGYLHWMLDQDWIAEDMKRAVRVTLEHWK